MNLIKHLEAIVAGLMSEENAFYRKAIKLHEDQKLRSIVKKYTMGEVGIKLGDEEDEYPNILYYGEVGFISCTKLILDPSYIGSAGRADYFYLPCRYHPFNVENNKLVANNKEMLELYHGLKIEKVCSALEEGIRQLKQDYR